MPSLPSTDEQRGVGILLAAVAFAMFSLLDILLKLLAGGYAVPQVIAQHCVFSLIPILAYAALHGGIRSNIRTRRPWMHLLRAGCSVLSGLSGLFALSRMPVADVYAFTFAAPLIITALSVPLLKEEVGWRRWTAVGVGFAGILVMLRPGAGAIDPGAFLALAAAFFYSMGMILSRMMRGTETSVSFAVFSCLAGLAANAPAAWMLWKPLALADFGIALLGGLIGGSALICLLTAFRKAPAAVVAPFQYSQMVWGIVLGYLVFGDLPTPERLAGSAVVIGSGLYILWRETVLGRGAATKRHVP